MRGCAQYFQIVFRRLGSEENSKVSFLRGGSDKMGAKDLCFGGMGGALSLLLLWGNFGFKGQLFDDRRGFGYSSHPIYLFLVMMERFPVVIGCNAI